MSLYSAGVNETAGFSGSGVWYKVATPNALAHSRTAVSWW